jgi:predicted dehydrogenase
VTDNGGALRAIVVGTSFGCQAHVRALRAAGFEVAALVGRDPKRTAERAAQFGIPQPITSYEEALRLPGLDAVVIASPPVTHKAYALQALEAGKHVLCEKPMAVDAAEAREMLAAAERAGRVHLLVNQLRFRPEFVTLRHAVASGELGALQHATLLFDVSIVTDRQAPGVPDWWYARSTGGGWLRNLGTHIFDLVRYSMGEFDSVSASIEPGSDFGIDADLGFNMLFKLKNGMQGVLQGSCAVQETGRMFRVNGAAATATVEGADVWRADRSGRRVIDPPGGYALPPNFEPLPDEPGSSTYHSNHNRSGGGSEYTALAAAFRAKIEGRDVGAVPPATFADGLAHMQVLEAIEAAAASGAWTKVPPPPR